MDVGSAQCERLVRCFFCAPELSSWLGAVRARPLRTQLICRRRSSEDPKQRAGRTVSDRETHIFILEQKAVGD